MKKIITTCCFLLVIAAANAQQDPHFTQFFHNRLNYNPAFAGTEEKICVLGMYRSQWVGFGGADKVNDLDVRQGRPPETFLFSINAPIGQKFGVGLNIYRDIQGFQELINPMLSLSYIHTFANQSKLSGGLAVGFMQKGVDGSGFTAQQEGDLLIPTGNVSGMALDLNGGIYYTMPTLWVLDRVYAGYSATHLNQSTITYGNVTESQVLHHYFMTGASYALNSAFDIEPNILVKRDRAKWSTDINTMVTWNNKVRGGLTYRYADAVSFLLGYKFTSDFQVGYSYDLTTSNIIKYSSGSHELFFRYCFMPKIKVKEKIIVPRLTPRFL
jgi:type IX secretion system PorP/SprF family membrane protein